MKSSVFGMQIENHNYINSEREKFTNEQFKQMFHFNDTTGVKKCYHFHLNLNLFPLLDAKLYFEHNFSFFIWFLFILFIFIFICQSL